MHFICKHRKMKKLLVIALVLAAFVAHSQNRSTVETRALTQSVGQAKSIAQVPQKLLKRYPVRYQNGIATIGVVGKVTPNFDESEIERLGGKVTSKVADIVSMRMPVMQLPALERCAGLVQYSVAHPVAPMMDKTRQDTRTDSVHKGIGLPQAFTGEGVLIGITDWGFDYRHPNINSDAERRILRAWDHWKLSGPAPSGFDYGTEYKTYQELYDAIGDTSNLYGYNSHGTHVAGISGGRGTKVYGNSQSKYVGQAPKAQFLCGSWYLDEASWLDQVAWMAGVAREEGKRLVINSSWGMYTFSNLDGTSLLSQAINHWSDSGIVFVTSAGNNGGDKFHLHYDFAKENDTVKTHATWYSGGIGQAIIYWGEPGKQFASGFYLLKDDLSDTLWGPTFSTSSDIAFQEGTLVSAQGDTVEYDALCESANMNDNRPHILMNVGKLRGYKLIVYAIGNAGAEVDMWNLCLLSNDAGNMGCDFANSTINGCKNGDPNYGIGEPACAEKTISVAAHSADYWKNDSTYFVGGITSFSSYGPAYGGGEKPEISAPGSNVVSSVNSRDASQTTSVAAVQANGTSYKYAAMSGTSMSSPAVTGVVALMLQANPHLTVDQIKHIIISTARCDEKTGDLTDSVSVRWGHGKIDALKCVAGALDLLDIEEATERMPELVVYPNPAREQVTIVTSTNQPSLLTVFGLDGRMIHQSKVNLQTTLNTSKWAHGVYVIKLAGPTGVRTSKLVVE